MRRVCAQPLCEGTGLLQYKRNWEGKIVMRLVLTALVYLSGLLCLFLAVGFLIDPAGSAIQLGVKADTPAAMATIRADFTAFFGITGAAMLWGAWRRNGDLLMGPAVVYGVAFTGRAIDMAVNGPYPGFVQPMAVEAFWTVLLIAAWRVLPHHKLEDVVR